jgi:hypothetical protein
LVSRVWLPHALLLKTSSDRQHIRPLFSRPLLVLETLELVLLLPLNLTYPMIYVTSGRNR